MTARELLALLEQDQELLEALYEHGILPRADEHPPDAYERARVARTLVRELDVNWPGVEIILRMRGEILDMHRQVAELFTLVRERKRKT